LAVSSPIPDEAPVTNAVPAIAMSFLANDKLSL